MKSFISDFFLFEDKIQDHPEFTALSDSLLPEQAFYKLRAQNPNSNFVLRIKETSGKYPLYYYYYKETKIIHCYQLTIDELEFFNRLRGEE